MSSAHVDFPSEATGTACKLHEHELPLSCVGKKLIRSTLQLTGIAGEALAYSIKVRCWRGGLPPYYSAWSHLVLGLDLVYLYLKVLKYKPRNCRSYIRYAK